MRWIKNLPQWFVLENTHHGCVSEMIHSGGHKLWINKPEGDFQPKRSRNSVCPDTGKMPSKCAVAFVHVIKVVVLRLGPAKVTSQMPSSRLRELVVTACRLGLKELSLELRKLRFEKRLQGEEGTRLSGWSLLGTSVYASTVWPWSVVWHRALWWSDYLGPWYRLQCDIGHMESYNMDCSVTAACVEDCGVDCRVTVVSIYGWGRDCPTTVVNTQGCGSDCSVAVLCLQGCGLDCFMTLCFIALRTVVQTPVWE